MTFLESLQELLRKFMDYRKAAGYATETYECTLTPYIRFCGENYPGSDGLTREMLDAWLPHYDYSNNTQAAFIACARQFARLARFLGKSAYVPDDDYTIRRIPYEPYLFPDHELEDFFDSVDRYVPATSGKRLRHDMVLPPLFRMMYCCGMRPGEPLMLLRRDVDTRNGDVYIRETKRHKDRHIIMAGNMRDMCMAYDSAAGDRTWFFEHDGKPYSTKWMASQFHRRWKEAGISGHGIPRPYDLRHAFAP